MLLAHNLEHELKLFTASSKLLATAVDNNDDVANVADYIGLFKPEEYGSTTFASRTASMWPAHEAQLNRLDVMDLSLAFERRRTMLASLAAWYWLSEHCATSILRYAREFYSTSGMLLEDDWQAQLVIAVSNALNSNCSVFLQAGDFIPELAAYDRCVRVPVGVARNDAFPERVCQAAISIVRQWLCFPTNTELVASHFVSHLIRVSRNMDILLLSSIWYAYRRIKHHILGTTVRASSINTALLNPFISALSEHPISDPLTQESYLLSEISRTVAESMSLVPEGIAATVATVFSVAPLAKRPTSSSYASQAITQGSTQTTHHIPALLELQQFKGLKLLVDFAKELLPLAHKVHPSSALQKLVASNLDYYLPFRELAPTRTRIRNNVDFSNYSTPGAFASYVIMRALFFAAPIIQESKESFHFTCYQDFEIFLDLNGFDPSLKASRQRFFKVNCYGTSQSQRGPKALTHVPDYFEVEKDWIRDVEKATDNMIPYLAFWKWAKGHVHGRSRLYLIGRLCSHLLAADLSYAGYVIPPTPDDIAAILSTQPEQFGSMQGLVDLGLIDDFGIPMDTISACFQTILNSLTVELSETDRKLVSLDVIMVEHLLCKYHRVTRDLQK